MPSSEFLALMDQKLDAPAAFKVEILNASGTPTDVTRYYRSGGGISQARNRYPDQIEAGSFDVVFANTDDIFSEYKAASLLFEEDYHQKWRVRISQGYRLADGSIEYLPQSTGIIDELVAGDSDSTITVRCRDRIGKLLEARLRNAATQAVGVPSTSNFSDGSISPIATLPFRAVDEDWTITCTTPGDDGVAQFSVVGSVSGSVGPATGGFEFSTLLGAGGIRFTLKKGTGNWVAGDAFTFSTRQAPEWTLTNPVKIVWAILTGYDWDSDAELAFSDMMMDYDHEQSDSNVDLDYNTFVQAISDVDALSTIITGYIGFNAGASEQIAGLLLLILGSLYTGNDGRMRMSTYSPTFNPDLYRNFADTKKITSLGYSRATQQAINQITVNYKDADVWEFSDGAEALGGNLVLNNEDSQTALGQTFSQPFTVPWFSPNGTHVEDFASRLLDKYGTPPVNLQFETVGDALATNIGDHVSVTDAKYGLDAVQGEVDAIDKNFDANPRSTRLTVRREGSDVNVRYGFLGSSEDEGDGISPQAASYDDATDSDKLFIYLGTEGGGAPVDGHVIYDGSVLPEDWLPPFSVYGGTIVSRSAGVGGYRIATAGGVESHSQQRPFVGASYLELDMQINDPTADHTTFNSVIAIINDHTKTFASNLFIQADRIANSAGASAYAIDMTVRHLLRFVPLSDDTCDLYVDGVLVHNFTGLDVPTGPDDYIDVAVKLTIDATFFKIEFNMDDAPSTESPPFPDYHLF